MRIINGSANKEYTRGIEVARNFTYPTPDQDFDG